MSFKFGLLADYVEVIRTIETSPCDKSQIRSEKDPLYLDATATDRECARRTPENGCPERHTQMQHLPLKENMGEFSLMG
jgi:hypothetical protein